MSLKCLIIACSVVVVFSFPAWACSPSSEDIVYPSEQMMNESGPNIIAVRGVIKNTTPMPVINSIPHNGFTLEVKITKNFHGVSFVGDTVMVVYGFCSSLKSEMNIGDEINIIAKNTDEKTLSVINHSQYSNVNSQLKN